MWKKTLIVLITLIGSFFVGYAYVNSQMDAASGTMFQLPKGVKVVLGKYNNREIVWDIGNNTSDYVLMSSKPITSMSTYDASIPITDTIQTGANRENYCLRRWGTEGSSIITYCPIAPVVNEINTISLNPQETAVLSRIPFLPSVTEVYLGGSLGLSVNDRAYKHSGTYLLKGYVKIPNYNGGLYSHNYMHVIQNHLDVPINSIERVSIDLGIILNNNERLDSASSTQWDYSGTQAYVSYIPDIRPFATLDKTKINFAANTSYTDGSWHSYTIDTANLNENNELNPNKLRIQSSLTASLLDIKRNNHSTQKVVKNQSVDLSVNANVGTNTKMSVILYDDAGTQIQYYKLGSTTQSGTNDYTIDLTGIPTGKYQVAVINEEYDASSNLPVESSAISDLMPLEIVDPHKLTYTKTPQSGASAGIDYEFSKNVNAGQAVGKVTANPMGLIPLTYSVETNGDNSYLNFEIGGLDSNNASSTTPLNVKIKSGAPDLVNGGLKAGNYKFCITAVDANGDPVDTSGNPTEKVCTSFTVEKTNPTIAFDDPSTTKKSIADAATAWNETATATPSGGTKITYTKVGGDVGMVNIDPDTGAITYSGGNAFGKVKIRATVDDDPATGDDNYTSAYVEKEIVIYREVDGVLTPDPASSDTTIPTFSASDANIRTGGTIGKIQGTLGTPDTIGGTTTTYSYAIKPGGDGSMFQVDSGSGEIKSNANLGVGSYHFDIIVSDHWSNKEIPVTVNVGMAPAENLKFYENATSSTMITTKTVALTDSGVSVFATVRGSSNTNPVTYRIQDGSSNVISVHPSSGAITIHGVGSVVIVAEKAGASGQANAQAELRFTVTAGSQQFIYTDASGNELPKSGNRYDNYTEVYAPGKTFQLYTAGNPSGSNVTYQLKAGSPTDVISVDPNGMVTILNASLNTQIGQVIVEATSHDPSGNYSDKTIELSIVIEKGTRTVAFSDNPIYVVSGSGSVTPTIEVDGVLDTSGTPLIEVDGGASSIAWTNDGVTIQYSWNDAMGKDVNIQVTKPADRNYREAVGSGILHILGAEENTLTLSTPGRVIYGDHFVIRSTQDDSMSTNVQYTFTTDNGVFLSAPQVNGNKAEFDALGYSGSTEITITVTRTADGELPLTKKVKIKVLPKPITIEIEDKEKKRLEDNPPLTYKDFKPQLVTWNGVQDTIDESVIKLSTSAGKYSPIGTYPIIAKNAQKQLNDNYPNYTFTIKEGKLNIKDNGDKNFWDTDDDGCPDLNIEIEDEEGNDITINGDVNEDGIPDYNIDSNGDGKPDLNIDTDHDGKPDLNLVILKEWKPSKCVTLGDIQYSSGITAKPEINIDVDGDLIPDIDIDTKGDFKPHINISNDGKTPHVNIAVIHTWKPEKDYKVGTMIYDSIDVNDSKPEINIDTDGDGYPDINLDLDNDGKPDINIDWDGDWIPDTQIDTTGDGKADTNIDVDGNGIPDENIKEITEWKPEHNVSSPFAYDTMRFDEPEDPNDDQEGQDKPNGDVQGSYYPGGHLGGALTGDATNVMTYIGFVCLSIGVIALILFKYKQDKNE